MKSWRISNGDLVLGPHGFAEVTGTDRVLQDLRLAVLEPFGSDRFHTKWGSLLQQMIGHPITPLTGQTIQSEILRLVQNYITIQNDIQSTAIKNGNRSIFGTNDLVSSIENINIVQKQTQMIISVTLKMVSNQTLTLNNTVTI